MSRVQRHLGFRAGWAIALVVGIATLAAAQDEELVEFRFQPVDGEVWTKEIDDVQVRDLGDVAPYQETETKTKIELRYEALPDGGWVVHQTPLSASMTINGEDFHNPGLEQTIGQEIQVTFSADGDAVSVDGFKEFLRKLERNLSPEMYAQVRQSASEESMAQSELRQWDSILIDLIGHPVHEGEIWRVIDEVSIAGGGTIGTDGILRFDGWTEIDGIRGFKVTYEWDSTGQKMASVGDDYTRSISRRTTDEVMPRTNVNLQGSLIRVIVPETGHLLYEVYDQSYELPLNKVGGPSAKMEQRHTYRFRKAS
jgi:hypothetical protein